MYMIDKEILLRQPSLRSSVVLITCRLLIGGRYFVKNEMIKRSLGLAVHKSGLMRPLCRAAEVLATAEEFHGLALTELVSRHHSVIVPLPLAYL